MPMTDLTLGLYRHMYSELWYDVCWGLLYLYGMVWIQCVPEEQRSVPHSWLSTGFVTRLTRQVPLVEQELFTFPEHLSSPPVFNGVPVTRSLVLCVCLVDRCLSFCSLCCLFFFDIRILITPLVSSNSSYLCKIEFDPGTSCIVKVCLHCQMFASEKYDLTNGMTTSIYNSIMVHCNNVQTDNPI